VRTENDSVRPQYGACCARLEIGILIHRAANQDLQMNSELFGPSLSFRAKLY